MSEQKKTLLVVEDDKGLQRQLRWNFEDYKVVIAEDHDSAIAQLRAAEPKVVTLDLGLPPDPDGATEGLRTLERILHLAPDAKVVVVTGNEDRQNALRAIAAGAYDFCQKPAEPEVLGLIVSRAFYLAELEAENRALARSDRKSPLSGVITGSAEMIEVCEMVEKVARAEISVLFVGGSGTGKELLARAVHDLSPRKKGPFVAINCAAIPENLLESELYGHEKGAFTGAVKQTPGKIELAEKGTLFLDEIGDLPLALQVKLLRFLQERVIERVGGRKEISVDVRVVSATHQDLVARIAEGRFREDLFYRLSEITIKIPPLKDRQGDAVLLAHNLLHKYGREMGRPVKGFTSGALASIEKHDWPGNVRELENRMKRAVIIFDGKRITATDLDFLDVEVNRPIFNLKQAREDADRQAIQRALVQSDGNISHAAKLLGISRPTFYDLVRHYDFKI
ncbi:MAG: PEP-CTERM-box response regulator transcription factor [Sphingomonadales bacterium]